MTQKQQLLGHLQRAYDEETNLIAAAGDNELAQDGAPDDWAMKDVFAHIGSWKALIAERLDPANLDNPSPLYALPVDEQNFQFYDEYAGHPWPEVRALIDRGYYNLRAAIEALPDEYLSEGDRFPWQDGRPLWQRIGHIGFYHPLYHLAELYRDRGDREQARALIVEATDGMSSLSGEAPYIGSYAYNLACFFALAGEKEQALKRLRQAFELRPDLIEWSKQDSDLDSLRDDLGYLTLLNPDG
jgi:tetratricopeptide (TPR) repeat protein